MVILPTKALIITKQPASIKKYWLTWNGVKETTNNKVSTLTNPISTFYNIHILQMLLLSNAYTIFTSHERYWGNRTYQMFYNFLYQKSIYLISLQSLVTFTDFFQPTKEITNELLPYNLFSSKNDFFFFQLPIHCNSLTDPT